LPPNAQACEGKSELASASGLRMPLQVSARSRKLQAHGSTDIDFFICTGMARSVTHLACVIKRQGVPAAKRSLPCTRRSYRHAVGRKTLTACCWVIMWTAHSDIDSCVWCKRSIFQYCQKGAVQGVCNGDQRVVTCTMRTPRSSDT
jgi:hypothetical protein